MRALWIIGLMVMLGACAPASPFPPDALIRWDTSAGAVVFRAEVAGQYADAPLQRANIVPACTVFGDGLVVYTQATSDGGEDVFTAITTREALTAFIEARLSAGLGDYTSRAGAVIPLDTAPIYQNLTLNFNDQTLQSDSFSDWPDDFYAQSVADCIALGADNAAPFMPESAWVTAQFVEQDSRAPVVLWDADAANFSLITLAESQDRVWVSGDTVRALWAHSRVYPDNLQFVESEARLQVAVQVPNVTLSAPPAP